MLRGAAKISMLQLVLAHPKCKGDVPLSVVECLLKLAPEIAEFRHLYTQNFPLHAVFYNPFFSSSKRVALAEMLIKASPRTLLMTNSDGRTPLHTFCTQHCNYEPLLAVLRAAPQTAWWKDDNGELPLHLACRSHKPPNKSIRALFNAYPNGILVKDNKGKTPLQTAKNCSLRTQRIKTRISLLEKLETFQLRQHGASPRPIYESSGRLSGESEITHRQNKLASYFPHILNNYSLVPSTQEWRSDRNVLLTSDITQNREKKRRKLHSSDVMCSGNDQDRRKFSENNDLKHVIRNTRDESCALTLLSLKEKP